MKKGTIFIIFGGIAFILVGLMISFAPGNPFFSSSPVILHVTQIS